MTPHIVYDAQNAELRLLDQRRLPGEETFFTAKTSEEVIFAIRDMVVRGAPAIGVTAAFGCVLALKSLPDSPAWRERLRVKLNELASARPTAVNLAWAVKRMLSLAGNINRDELTRVWLGEALAIQKEDEEICRKIGENGRVLIKNNDTVLTHCNAGALATAGYGTALGVIRAAVDAGKKIKVIADETRPLLQGARLTAWELSRDNIPVKVACDNACATLMSKNLVNLVVVGADRIAANGDTANKIGTFGVAIIARHFNVPFYVAAPLSTIDLSLTNGAEIPIEERDAEEIKNFAGVRVTPLEVDAYNFAFDVTPANLISGIITEKGVLYPPYDKTVARAFSR